ncbi:MAG: hypothetical protein Q7S09_02660 [bacterium]|nr:hypothetical protein [bacterium]
MGSRELKRFLERFKFRPDLCGYVGIERERFLTRKNGVIVPEAKQFLENMGDSAWTYELSACQVEDRTIPRQDPFWIRQNLLQNDYWGGKAARKLELYLSFKEVGPRTMRLDVYPDPRYLEIVKHISRARLSAACRVTGTHIHIGVANMEEAIRVHNVLGRASGYLAALGDHSRGERLKLYRTMAPDWKVPVYESAEHFFEVAKKKGFAKNPRNCWNLVRISAHGTVECRAFGVTPDVDEIMDWVSAIRSIAKEGTK